MATKKSRTEEPDVTTVETPVEKQIEPTIPRFVSGTVNESCKYLNVRKEPSADADVAKVIKAGTAVRIDNIDSTDEYYKVRLTAGVKGYCVKKYISIR